MNRTNSQATDDRALPSAWRQPWRGWPRLWPLAPAGLIFLGLFAVPLAYFLAISFWSVRARVMRPDFTLRNYIATWTDYGDTLASTLIIALAISLVTTILAFGFA